MPPHAVLGQAYRRKPQGPLERIGHAGGWQLLNSPLPNKRLGGIRREQLSFGLNRRSPIRRTPTHQPVIPDRSRGRPVRVDRERGGDEMTSWFGGRIPFGDPCVERARKRRDFQALGIEIANRDTEV